jgi:hypothetical protein
MGSAATGATGADDVGGAAERPGGAALPATDGAGGSFESGRASPEGRRSTQQRIIAKHNAQATTSDQRAFAAAADGTIEATAAAISVLVSVVSLWSVSGGDFDRGCGCGSAEVVG